MGLDILAAMAGLLAKNPLDQAQKAARNVAHLVLDHPASASFTREKAATLLEKLEAGIPASTQTGHSAPYSSWTFDEAIAELHRLKGHR